MTEEQERYYDTVVRISHDTPRGEQPYFWRMRLRDRGDH